MRRLFLAIDLPERIKDDITATYLAIPGVRWNHEEQLHLTLRFFGELPGDCERMLIQALSAVTVPSFSLQIRGAGYFPPRGRARTVWLSVSPQTVLSRVVTAIEKQVVKTGCKRESRKFKGHITVARCSNAPIDQIAGYIAANSLFTTEPFEVNAFHLYASHLGKTHATYTREITFPLGKTTLPL